MKKNTLILAVVLITVFLDLNAQTKYVTIDQKLSTGQQVGVLKKWEGSNWSNPFSPGAGFSFSINSDQTILGDQTIHSNQKYNNWNDNFSNVKNHQAHTITNETNELLSNFLPTATGVTIKTSLEGTSVTGGVVKFKDPWFIDYPDVPYDSQLRNRGMNDADPKERTSPFYPNSTTQYEYGQTYRGVFLGQPMVAGRSHYKVSVPDEQIIQVHGQNRKFYSYKWDGDDVDYNQPNEMETGVVFTESDAVSIAVLKGELMSNDQSGISNNSQRKIVTTYPGYNYIVYESMGNIWLSVSEEGEWIGEILLKTNAKNPSMDQIDGALTITFEYWDGALKICFMQLNTYTNNIEEEISFTISTNSNYFGTLKPIIASIDRQHCIMYKPSPSSCLKYRVKYRETINSPWYWSNEFDVLNTDQSTLNWAITSDHSFDYHIALQQGTSTIYYMHGNRKVFDEIQFCSYTNLSQGSGFTTNQYPSISVSKTPSDEKVMVSWTGYYHSVLDKGLHKYNA